MNRANGIFRPMHRLLALLALILLPVSLQAAQLAIVLSSEDPAFQEFVTAIKKNLYAGQWRVSWEGNTERFEQNPPGRVDLIITAGAKATRLALTQADGPAVIASLMTQAAFESIKQESPHHRQGLTALYLDQPISRQLAFINQVLPTSTYPNRQIFTAVSDPQSKPLSALRQQAHGAGFKLTAAVTTQADAIPAIENQLSSGKGLFLALPDNAVFARDNIRPFLLTTYRYKIPVIGFSIPFVNAGALAALHTTPVQFGQELSRWVEKIPVQAISSNLPTPRGPSQYSVTINPQVARSFKLSPPTESEIVGILKAMEERQP